METMEPPASPKHSRRNGRDEMNLAEFPITLLTDRAPQGQKTLVFRDGEQTLTVTSSDAFGLPTAVDADVIVALIHLTKQANNFTDPTVSFTRYGLIRLLGWPLKGSNYQRLTQSLKCWTGVTLNYEKAWWDNKAKRRVDATFHILETVVISECSTSDNEDELDPATDQPVSSFTWNKRFFQSCRADNLKRLDLDVYFSLRSSISKRMYRFLDKRFFQRASWTFDLREFAYDHVGMCRNYSDNGKLKEKLGPAIKELEEIGYLQPASPKERYAQVRRGHWTITLARRPEGTVKEIEPPQEPGSLDKELTARGVTALKARSITADYPAERIARQIEYVDYIQEKHPGAIRNRAGYLRRAVEEDYAAPPGFVSKAERAEREQTANERRRADSANAERRSEAVARERVVQERIIAHLNTLSMVEVEDLDRQILADPEVRASYDRQFPGLKRIYLELLRKDHVRAKLNLPDPPAE